jgi:hypothetical protein
LAAQPTPPSSVEAAAAALGNAGALQALGAGHKQPEAAAEGVTPTPSVVQAAPAAATAQHTGWLLDIRPQDVQHRSLRGKRVRLGRLIAAGGYSLVYEGHTEDASSSSSSSSKPPDCAVKVFTVTPGAPAKVVKVLQQSAANEVEALQLLQHHPSVVKLLALGQLQTPHSSSSSSSSSSAAVRAAVQLERSWVLPERQQPCAGAAASVP